VGADCRDKDDGVVWVAERAAGCEIVGCGAGGRGDADAVCLDGGEVFVVAEEFDCGHCLRVVSSISPSRIDFMMGWDGITRLRGRGERRMEG